MKKTTTYDKVAITFLKSCFLTDFILIESETAPCPQTAMFYILCVSSADTSDSTQSLLSRNNEVIYGDSSPHLPSYYYQ